jgi:hypothetical protein
MVVNAYRARDSAPETYSHRFAQSIGVQFKVGASVYGDQGIPIQTGITNAHKDVAAWT